MKVLLAAMLLSGMLAGCTNSNRQTTDNDMDEKLELTQEWDKDRNVATKKLRPRRWGAISVCAKLSPRLRKAISICAKLSPMVGEAISICAKLSPRRGEAISMCAKLSPRRWRPY